jgi:hypothetical protein
MAVNNSKNRRIARISGKSQPSALDTVIGVPSILAREKFAALIFRAGAGRRNDLIRLPQRDEDFHLHPSVGNFTPFREVVGPMAAQFHDHVLKV